MKTKVSIQKVIIGSALSIAILVAGFSIYTKNKLNEKLSNEKLKSEMLLSEKLNLNKSIAKYQADASDLKNKNSKLNNTIEEINFRISEKNAEIKKLKSENASAKELQKKYTELEGLKEKLTQEIALANKALKEAKNENSKLNDLLADALQENEELLSDNSVLKSLFSDSYRTEALRGKNEKLTVIAKRTNKLTVSLNMPATTDNNIQFKIVTPQGKEISSSNDLAAVIKIIDNGDDLMASSSDSAIGSIGTKRVEMSYKPSEKLSKGVYQFNLYNNDRFLGSTQLRLK
jgi:SMC interacting uncharacterized protein involved in chromosome segregation